MREARSDTRAVVISEARQVGETALARLVADGHASVEVRFLDDAATWAAADPAAFVGSPGLLVADEVQRVPEVMLAVKHEVDLDPRPGRFLPRGP